MFERSRRHARERDHRGARPRVVVTVEYEAAPVGAPIADQTPWPNADRVEALSMTVCGDRTRITVGVDADSEDEARTLALPYVGGMARLYRLPDQPARAAVRAA